MLRRVGPLVPLVLFLGALAVHQAGRGALFTSDTIQLLEGVAAADACLEAGEWRCERGVDKWPLLQYLPALAMKRAGLSRDATAEGLVALNGLAFLALIALTWWGLAREGMAARAVAVAALLASPLLWYAGTGFGEALAALLTAAVVVGAYRGWHPGALAAFVFAAGISKETALPFVLALGLIAVRLRRVRGGEPRSAVPALLAGGALAFAASVAFNLFRYGQVYNDEYARSGWVVVGIGRRIEFFAAQLIAPNGGVAWFWPIAAAVMVAALVAGVRYVRQLPEARLTLAAAVVGAVVIGSLASWWSPFGWEAYAGRLFVPWVPALMLVALFAWPGGARRAARALLRPPVPAAAVCALAIVAAAPQAGAFLDREAPFALFDDGAASCRALPRDLYQRVRAGDAAVQELHSACTSERAWAGELVLADGYRAFRGDRIAFAVLLAAALGGLTIAARRDAVSG